MKWTNSYRSFGLKTKRSTGLKTIEHKHPGVAPETLRRWSDKTGAAVAAETRQSAGDAMAELRGSRAEAARLGRVNGILTAASAFFAARLGPARR